MQTESISPSEATMPARETPSQVGRSERDWVLLPFINLLTICLTLLSKAPSRDAGRNVELYNEGMIYGAPRRLDLAFQQALEAQPDLILWILSPWDLANASVADAPWAKVPVGLFSSNAKREPETAGVAAKLRTAWKRVIDTLDRSRTAIMLHHFSYMSQTPYVRSYLMQDEGGPFLRARQTAATKEDLLRFETYAASIATKARQAGVPLAVTLTPPGPQATMIAMGKWPAGFDPYRIGDEMRDIVESHGGIYLDILHGFRQIPEPQRFFTAVDGHPTAEGHAVLTKLVAKALEADVPMIRTQQK